MWRSGVLILGLFHLSPGLTAESLRFRCESSLKPENLLVEKQGRVFRLMDLRFETHGLLSPQVHCQRWLDEWYTSPRVQPDRVQIHELWTGRVQQSLVPARLSGDGVVELYDRCIQFGRCQVPFPYRLRHWIGKWFLHPGQKTAALDRGSLDSSICRAQVPSKPELSQTPSKPKESLRIAPVDFEWVPWKTPLDFALKVINQARQGPVFVSAMVMSASQWTRLVEAVKRRPDLQVFLMLDLLTSASDPEISLFFEDVPENLEIFFAHRSLQHPKYFHSKVAVDAGKSGLWMFTSGNFRSYDEHRVLDWNFLFQDFESAQDLATLWRKRADSYCGTMEALECSLEARFTRTDRIRNSIRLRNASFCSSIHQQRQLPSLRNFSSRFFWSKQDTGGLAQGLIQWLESSQETLVGFADVWDSQEFWNRLQVLRSLGRPTFLWQGLSFEESSDEYFAEPSHARLQTPDGLGDFRAHMKGFLKDGRALFLTSANMTDNGLHWNEEIGFAIEGSWTAALVDDLKNTLFQSKDVSKGQQHHGVPKPWGPPGSSLRVFGKMDDVTEAQRFFGKQNLKVRAQDWLASYPVSQFMGASRECEKLGRRLAYEWSDDLKKCLGGQAP